MSEIRLGAVDHLAAGIADFADEKRPRPLALVAQGGKAYRHLQRSGCHRAAEQILAAHKRPGDATTLGQPFDFRRPDLAARLHRLARQHQLAALGGRRCHKWLEGRSQIARGTGAIKARVTEVAPADEGEHGTRPRLGGDGGKLHVGRLGSRRVGFVHGMPP